MTQLKTFEIIYENELTNFIDNISNNNTGIDTFLIQNILVENQLIKIYAVMEADIDSIIRNNFLQEFSVGNLYLLHLEK